MFDAVEDEFFASAEGLSKVEAVENFDDLDSGVSKKPAARWSLMSLFRPAPPAVRPKATTPAAKSPTPTPHKPTSNAKKR